MKIKSKFILIGYIYVCLIGCYKVTNDWHSGSYSEHNAARELYLYNYTETKTLRYGYEAKIVIDNTDDKELSAHVVSRPVCRKASFGQRLLLQEQTKELTVAAKSAPALACLGSVAAFALTPKMFVNHEPGEEFNTLQTITIAGTGGVAMGTCIFVGSVASAYHPAITFWMENPKYEYRNVKDKDISKWEGEPEFCDEPEKRVNRNVDIWAQFDKTKKYLHWDIDVNDESGSFTLSGLDYVAAISGFCGKVKFTLDDKASDDPRSSQDSPENPYNGTRSASPVQFTMEPSYTTTKLSQQQLEFARMCLDGAGSSDVSGYLKIAKSVKDEKTKTIVYQMACSAGNKDGCLGACKAGDAIGCLGACEAGDAGACSSLGNIFDLGLYGNKDEKIAIYYREKACNYGSSGDCEIIAREIGEGKIVEVDNKDNLVSSYLEKACVSGSKGACEKFDSIKKKRDDEIKKQIEEAEKEAKKEAKKEKYSKPEKIEDCPSIIISLTCDDCSYGCCCEKGTKRTEIPIGKGKCYNTVKEKVIEYTKYGYACIPDKESLEKEKREKADLERKSFQKKLENSVEKTREKWEEDNKSFCEVPSCVCSLFNGKLKIPLRPAAPTVC